MQPTSGSISFDPIAERYDNTRYYPPAVAAQIAEGLMHLGGLSAGSSLLEIGIGTGRIALPLLAKGINVTGVDISPRMVEVLRQKLAKSQAADTTRVWGTLNIVMADMTALPFDTDSFDGAVGVHVFHLVPGWQRALDEVLRVVRPGGAFLLGQDTRAHEAMHGIHDRWDEIIHELGYTIERVGAEDYETVVAELRSRGLTYDEHNVTTWQEPMPPRSALKRIVDREWSQTWRIPDDIFAESARRITAWAEQQFGAGLDTPQPITYAFKVARVHVPETPPTR